MRKIDGKSFSTGNQIAHELQAFNTALTSSNNLTGLSRADFAKEASALFGLLNSIHPFREGNGRVQRLFFQLLAKEAGHPLNFAGVTKERMTLASISSHEKGDNSMFERLFLEISDQSRGLLLEDGLMRLIQAYDKHGTRFDPNEIYMTTFTPGETKTVQFVGVSGNQFAARTQNQIFFGLAVNLPKPIPKPGQKFTFHEPSLGDGDSDDTPNGSSGRGKITPHKPSGRGGYGD